MTATAQEDDDVAAAALTFSYRDAADAEAAIAELAAHTIRYWRLHEATFWQRVKFRARLLRAARTSDARIGENTGC